MDVSPAERSKVILFLALFFGAAGFLSTLLSCGTGYWLLAAQTCGPTEPQAGGGVAGDGKSSSKALDNVRNFHEGLFWRCSFAALSHEYSILDLWISNPPPSMVCQAAFLFPFPANEPEPPPAEPHTFPAEPSRHRSAVVFRTFWSIFLVGGVAAVVIGGIVVLCAGPLDNHRLYKVGGVLQVFGGLCLLAVLVMYLMWVQVLDTLEQFVFHQRARVCPAFHLSTQHGPSFLLAPVAVFFCLLAGVLFVLVGKDRRPEGPDLADKTPQAPPAAETCL